MARIDDKILESSIYLYPNVQEALDGEKSGGSGFLTGVRSQVSQGGYIYAVTNSHVIREAKSPVIRLNTIENDIEVIDCPEQAWYHHPNGDDLAVCPLFLHIHKYKLKFVPIEMFISPEVMAKEEIGAGDEVFMVGRFIGYDGKQRNTPTVRFGNMSIGTAELIRHDRGHLQESFLIETRSLSGYSGSPVFIYIPPFSKRPKSEGWSGGKGPWLLGIDYGHKHFFEAVLESNCRDEVKEGWKVRTNSGITCIIPAWKLLELLNIKEFTETRRKIDEEIANEQKKKGGEVTLDSVDLTKDQFHEILNKASKPIKKPESDSEQS